MSLSTNDLPVACENCCSGPLQEHTVTHSHILDRCVQDMGCLCCILYFKPVR